LNCESLKQFYELWSDSWFGNDPSREKSAWVIQTSTGKLKWIRWPASRKWKGEIWKGNVPANLIAQVHTHPLKTDPRPSYNDVVFAHNVKTNLYTISREAIWKVTPGGTITEVGGAKWQIRSNKQICAELVHSPIDSEALPLVSPMQYTKIQGFAWYRLHQDD